MNERIKLLAEQARKEYLKLPTGYRPEQVGMYRELMEKFAELIVKDYAKKTIQGLMSDPAFVQAMDEYYENKWSHRFD